MTTTGCVSVSRRLSLCRRPPSQTKAGSRPKAVPVQADSPLAIGRVCQVVGQSLRLGTPVCGRTLPDGPRKACGKTKSYRCFSRPYLFRYRDDKQQHLGIESLSYDDDVLYVFYSARPGTILRLCCCFSGILRQAIPRQHGSGWTKGRDDTATVPVTAETSQHLAGRAKIRHRCRVALRRTQRRDTSHVVPRALHGADAQARLRVEGPDTPVRRLRDSPGRRGSSETKSLKAIGHPLSRL